VRVSVDTNVLIRAVVRDVPEQALIAEKLLQNAQLIAIPMIVLCECVWVLRSVYRFSSSQIASAIRALVASRNVECDHAATEAGLAILDSGGDFADGVIAHQGKWLGGEIFVSFDKEAVALLKAQGSSAQLL
jgi:predicted nucleic-acid-binding protein